MVYSGYRYVRRRLILRISARRLSKGIDFGFLRHTDRFEYCRLSLNIAKKEGLMEELELTPAQAKEAIRFFFDRMPYLPILLCGPSGIGKTDITRQIASENQWEYLDTRLAGMLPEDLRGYPKAETWTDVAARSNLGIRGVRRPQIEYVLVDKLTRVFETEGPGILDFEELNRAHPDTHQPIFQLIGDRAMDGRVMGGQWRIIGSINPEDDRNYMVNAMDMAFTRRWLTIRVKPDVNSWLEYAKQNFFHPAVIEYVKANPSMLFKPLTERLTLMPAVWERASKLLYSFKSSQEIMTKGLIPIQLTLGVSVGLEVLDMASKNVCVSITPMDIIRHYASDKALQGAIREKVEAGHMSELARLADALSLTMEEWNINTILFALDLPNDTCQMLISRLRSEVVDFSDPEMKQALAKLYLKMDTFEMDEAI